MLNLAPYHFSSLVLLVATSWDFEAFISYFWYLSQCLFSLQSIVSFSMVLIFSLAKMHKFSLKSLVFLDISIVSTILSSFLGWKLFVEKIYLTKSTLDLGTALCNIFWVETLFITSVKHFLASLLIVKIDTSEI